MEIRFDKQEAIKLVKSMEDHYNNIYEMSKSISDLMCNFKEWDDENRKRMELALQELNEIIIRIAENESSFTDYYKAKISKLEV